MALNENVEGAGAKSMANSTSKGKDTILGYVTNRFLYGGGNNSNSSSSSSSSSSASSKGKTGNGWTAEDYKNYGDWQERHYGLHNDSQDKEVYRQGKALEHKTHLEQTVENARAGREELRRNNDVIRTKRTMDHAKAHGQLASVDFNHDTGRHQISFGATPPSETVAGNGAGAQGTSQQQARPGGRGTKSGGTGRQNMRTIFHPETKEVTGISVSGRKDKWDSSWDNRPAVKAAVKAGAKAGTAPGMTAGEATAAAPVRKSRGKKA
jgi:hypothetical protein